MTRQETFLTALADLMETQNVELYVSVDQFGDFSLDFEFINSVGLDGYIVLTGISQIDHLAVRGLIAEKEVVEIKGDFARKQTVVIQDMQGAEIGRGVVNFSADEIQKIKGKHSKEISSILGEAKDSEIIHRDRLVIFEAYET